MANFFSILFLKTASSAKSLVHLNAHLASIWTWVLGESVLSLKMQMLSPGQGMLVVGNGNSGKDAGQTR